MRAWRQDLQVVNWLTRKDSLALVVLILLIHTICYRDQFIANTDYM